MKIRHQPCLFLLILICLSPGLGAQENREADHSCFNLDEKRVTLLELKATEGDSSRLSCSFPFNADWSDKEIFLALPGTNNPYSIWINNFRFGSDPGSGNPSEFRLTPFIVEGSNILEVETSGSIEAALLIREAFHIRNLVITKHPGKENDFLVRFHLYLKSYLQGKNRGRSIILEAEDPDGNSIFLEKRELSAPLSYGQETEMIIDLPLQDPRYWLPGNPSLYGVTLTVDEGGESRKETLSSLFHVSNGQVLDSLFIQNKDSVKLVYCPETLAKIFHKLTESEKVFLIEDHGFNAIHLNEPRSCEENTFLLKQGILGVEAAE